jgi:predicted permease
MAKEMGGDEQLAGQIVVWTSLLAIITLFIIVVVLRTLGAL